MKNHNFSILHNKGEKLPDWQTDYYTSIGLFIAGLFALFGSFCFILVGSIRLFWVFLGPVLEGLIESFKLVWNIITKVISWFKFT